MHTTNPMPCAHTVALIPQAHAHADAQVPARAVGSPAAPLAGPVALGARVANLVLQAQVQFAYACAENARERAQRTSAAIETTWPPSPMREVVLGMYRAQARSAATAAGEVLANARRRCGLAFARGL